MKLGFHGIVSAAWLLLIAAGSLAQERIPEVPQEVTVCALLHDPAAWNHKLIQLSGVASHGFEDSGFYDPACNTPSTELWMEYGGTVTTRTVSTASSAKPARSQLLEVEGIRIPLVDNSVFRDFDNRLHAGAAPRVSANVRATVIARFFSGQLVHLRQGDSWGGYGHLGCCSLLVIEQVLKVDPPAPSSPPTAPASPQ